MKYKTLSWLIPISSKEWNLIKTYNSYGVTKNHRAIKRIAKGDLLVFYVTKASSKKLGGKVVGIYKVVSDWLPCSEKVLPERECKRYPIQAKIEPIIVGEIDLWSISDRLSFIKKGGRLSFYLKGTPANANRPIPHKDLELISELMKTKPKI